jgi:PAS domain-containing protein
MKCLLCERQIPWLRRLVDDRFCSDEHRRQYRQAHDASAVTELVSRQWEAGEEPAHDRTGEPLPRRDYDEPPGAAAGVREPERVLSANPAPTPVGGEFAELLAMLEVERAFYQEILDNLPHAIAIAGGDLGIEYANRPFRRLVGMEDCDFQAEGAGCLERLGLRETVREFLEFGAEEMRVQVPAGTGDRRPLETILKSCPGRGALLVLQEGAGWFDGEDKEMAQAAGSGQAAG